MVTQIPKAECEALVALYNSTFGPYWTNRTGWLANYTPCSWSRVTCEGGHVTELWLTLNGLTGSIPSRLGDLSYLEALDMQGNHLTGSIPETLGSLSNLQLLWLTANQLTGSVPSSLGNLSRLTTINLGGNSLTSSIPESLGSLQNLLQMELGGNALVGTIPATFGNLSNLEELGVSFNPLMSGSLPQSLKNLSSLDTFRFDNTNLCEPPDAVFQAWLAGIQDLKRTGVLCVPTATPTRTPTRTLTLTPTRAPTATRTRTRTPTITPTATTTFTKRPTNTPGPSPTWVPGTIRRAFLPIVLKDYRPFGDDDFNHTTLGARWWWVN